jgi:soluble lytic murein transglycosylase-like protein
MTQQQTPPSRRRPKQLPRWARDGALVIVLVAAIAYATTIVKPVYTGRGTVVGSVLRQVSNQPELAPAPAAPFVTGPLADSVRMIEASPEFAEQRRRFAADLVATGRMSQARADSIAHFAVREAFLRGVPPAVIFGVMLTENAQFVSRARSNVGAVGLMQVYPKYWFKQLSQQFGDPNIEADSTNLRYGVFILEHYLKPRGKAATGEHLVATAPGSLMKGLLRYNGCVRGTNTPRCHTYPNKVQQYVERDAQALCGDKSFYDCIAQPFMAGLLGQRGGD